MLNAIKDIINTTGSNFEQGVLAKIMPAGSMRPPLRTTAGALQAYSTMPWLNACTNKVANSTAMVQWKLFRVGGKNGKPKFHRKLFTAKHIERRAIMKQLRATGEMTEIETHPFLDLLDFGCAQFNGVQVMRLSQIYMDTVGECVWLLERNPQGMPVGLWPIPSHWVADFPTIAKPYFRIQFKTFVGDIATEDVVLFMHPDPLNPYGRGAGTAVALADELDTDEFAAQFTRSFFQNRARPDVIISGKGLGKDETRRLEVGWLQKHQGFFKAFKPAFISADIEVKELGTSMKQTGTRELREFERNVIMQVYGVPPELFGVIENSNRATIDAADFLFAKHLLVPRLELLRTIMQEKLIPQFDERIILDYETPVEEDKQYHLEAAKAAPWARTVDEWRELQGLEPAEGGMGGGFMVPFNMMYVPALDAPVAEPQPPATTPPAAPKHVRKVITQGDAVTVSNAAEDPLVLLSTESLVRGINDLLFDTLGQAFIEELGVSLSLQRTHRVSQFIHTQSTDRIKLLGEFTKSEIRRVLETGILAGDEGEALAASLGAMFDDWSAVRALRVARTESTRVTAFSAMEAMQQAGIEKKEWITTMDGHERDTALASHHAMDGQVVMTTEKFRDPVAGHMADMPGNFGIAAEDINCRCAITARFAGQEDRSHNMRETIWKNNESRRVLAEKRLADMYRKVFTIQRAAVLKRLREINAA